MLLLLIGTLLSQYQNHQWMNVVFTLALASCLVNVIVMEMSWTNAVYVADLASYLMNVTAPVMS